MTAPTEKSAEMLARDVVNSASQFCNTDYPEYFSNLEKLIAEALTQYSEEKVKEAAEIFVAVIADMRGKCYSKAAEQDLRKARDEALEEAARLVGEIRCAGPLGSISPCGMCAGCLTAKAIRSLKGAPKGVKKLKLFVWHDIRRDWTSGIAFALANSVEEAREEIKKVSESWEWDSYKAELMDEPEVHEKPFGFWMSGGS